MSKIGIFYGSSTGSTSEVAQRLGKALGAEANIFDVASASAAEAAAFAVLLLGSSGKKVALFGCGDADSYPDSFCEALAKIKEGLAGAGVTFIGAIAPEGYSYDATASEEDGKLIGLCIDEANQSDLTDERIEKWVALIQPEL